MAPIHLYPERAVRTAQVISLRAQEENVCLSKSFIVFIRTQVWPWVIQCNQCMHSSVSASMSRGTWARTWWQFSSCNAAHNYTHHLQVLRPQLRHPFQRVLQTPWPHKGQVPTPFTWLTLKPTLAATSLLKTPTGCPPASQLFCLSSTHSWADRAKRHKDVSAKPSQQEYTQAATQRTLAIQYEGQEVGHPGKTDQQLGTSWSPVTKACEFIYGDSKQTVPKFLDSCSTHSQVIKGYPSSLREASFMPHWVLDFCSPLAEWNH